jgi:hypothetical protein
MAPQDRRESLWEIVLAAGEGSRLSTLTRALAKLTFTVANADQLAARNFAFNNFAGPMQGYPDPALASFDWGLPFSFGRIVYNAIETRNTPAGTGPYFAF